MSRKTTYSAEFKSKVVLDVLQGNKEINEIATEYGIHPNLVRSWKKDFVNNAQRVFDESKREKEIRRRESISICFDKTGGAICQQYRKRNWKITVNYVRQEIMGVSSPQTDYV